nr:MAG TPA: putative protease-like protein [Caudoviricetes sp.]
MKKMMNDFIKEAHKIIHANCQALSVPVPNVRIAEPSDFAAPTIQSAVSKDGKELLINRTFAESKTSELFLWMALSHECRHVWQATNGREMFEHYKQSNGLSVFEYNAQPAEVDAWGWAVAVMSKIFGVRPTLEENFGTDLWNRIDKRAREICSEDL